MLVDESLTFFDLLAGRLLDGYIKSRKTRTRSTQDSSLMRHYSSYTRVVSA